jgi:hypothetical protein
MSERTRFSLEAAAALAAHRLVKLSSGKAAYMTATATDDLIGVNELACASGGQAGGKFINCEGTIEVEAAGAITAGADVYAAADGKVSALSATAGTYRKIGIAMKAASAAGSIIEVLPCDYITTTVVSE